jgi:hypothetical protein
VGHTEGTEKPSWFEKATPCTQSGEAETVIA